MKSHLTVLVDSQADSIEAQLIEALEKYRRQEGATDSDQPYRWDSWLYYYKDDRGDEELKTLFPNEPEEVLWNACYVNSLPTNYETSALICPQGRWWDLLDSGWTLEFEPSVANDKAYWKWMMTLKSLFNQYSDCIAVQLIVDN